ncbi:hypothetical protein [Methylobacterium tarhaniae]|uniref:hypothetical protein n=1 Tax=Methylobacterium tarhaniae TaxID=1187852 RepID=UPI0012ED9C48|nr:hypothetical protein [Methylobacterium tarhaniae]
MSDNVKLALIVLAKSFFVSWLMGFLSVLATYAYAMKSGIRVPAEGVAYISIVIGVSSWAIYILSAIVLFLIFIAFRYLKNRIGARIENESLQRISETLRQFIAHSFGRIALTVFAIFLAWYLWVEYQYDSKSNTIPVSFYYSIIYASLMALVSLVSWCLFSDQPAWKWQIYATVPLVIVMTFMFFAGDNYGYLLRSLRFGGGLQATLEFKKPDGYSTSPVAGYILMRSNDYIFFWNCAENIQEFPIKDISAITMKSNPEWNTPYYNKSGQKCGDK